MSSTNFVVSSCSWAISPTYHSFYMPQITSLSCPIKPSPFSFNLFLYPMLSQRTSLPTPWGKLNLAGMSFVN